jgi:protein SCO1
MWLHALVLRVGFCASLFTTCVGIAAEPLASPELSKINEKSFAARGVVKQLEPGGRTVLVSHEAITNYMDGMTMPFKVKESQDLNGLAVGDLISFQLHVTETESWIGQIVKIGTVQLDEASQPASLGVEGPPAAASHPLLAFKFTNELGQAVSLGEFRGQALAITFFFTRCPIPDYCPRISRNFEEVQRKLSATAHAPTNWHLVSVTFDPAHDTPEVLSAYATSYHYDPAHWSFLTGPSDKIAELTRLCDVKFEADSGFFNHNFRTLIIDASNRLQMVFPTSGDLSDAIVQELLKGARATNPSTQRLTSRSR